jgi:hypothetical protein
MLVNGIVDLGLLNYALDPAATAKRRTIPPQRQMGLDWEELADPPQGQHRTGKKAAPESGRGTVYDYFYFGPGVGEQADSPFATFSRPVHLSATLQAGDRERKQALILGKRTKSPLFQLKEPAKDRKFYRNQRVEVVVEMEVSEFFGPEQFELTACLYEAGQVFHTNQGEGQPGHLFLESTTSSAATASSALTQISLTADKPSVGSSGPATFSGHIPLGELRRRRPEVDWYTLVVTVRGISDSSGREHALSGFFCDLPPRTFAVDNLLILKAIDAVELSRQQRHAIIDVEAAFPIEDNVPLHTEFRMPSRDDRPLERDQLLLVNSQGEAVGRTVHLQRGRAQLHVGFNRRRGIPEGGVTYAPGRIVLTTADDTVRMEPLAVEVRLVIDLARVELTPATNTLVAEPQPVYSQLRVQLAPGDVLSCGIADLTARITPHQQESSPAGGKMPEEPANPGADPFGSSELWLQKAADPISTTARNRMLPVSPQEDFMVCFHPTGNKRPGKYHYDLVVTGKGIYPTKGRIVLDVNAPRVELEHPEQTLYMNPGSTKTIRFPARLLGLAGEAHPVHFEEATADGSVTFVSEEEGSKAVPLIVDCPRRDGKDPVFLQTPETDRADGGWRTVPVTVTVPEGTPCGRYTREFTVTGDAVGEATLRLNVVVNALEIYLRPHLDGYEPFKWEQSSQTHVVQFFDRPMVQEIWLSTGLKDTLTRDQVRIQILEDFEDESQDRQRAPSETEDLQFLEQPDGSLILRLGFPAASNANSQGRPYELKVHVSAAPLHVDDEQVLFQVMFWDSLKFLEG